MPTPTNVTESQSTFKDLTRTYQENDKVSQFSYLLTYQKWTHKQSSQAKHTSIFQGAQPKIFCLQGRIVMQKGALAQKTDTTAKTTLIPRKRKSSFQEMIQETNITTYDTASLSQAQIISILIDGTDSYLRQFAAIPGHSEQDRQRMDQLSANWDSIIHDNSDLDQIVECANLYFAIKVLVNQLIRQTEEQTRDILRLIKSKKADIDALGDLMSVLTMVKSGEVDFSKDPRVRELIDRARALGIPFPPGQYAFNQNQIDDYLKSIEMKRQSIESMNQTTMVELQEKQSRYNSMYELATHMQKQLEHILRTILSNMRSN